MAHDYAKKPRTKTATKKTTKSSAKPRQRTAAKSPVPGWVWLFVGTAVGAFIMFLVRLSEVDTVRYSSSSSKTQGPSTAEASRQYEQATKQNNTKAEINTQKAPPMVGSTTTNAVKSTDKKAEETAQNQEQKPRFDFYHMLKENEVPVAQGGSKAEVTGQAKSPRIFILQVASFKAETDAEQLKVELILMNLEARSEKVTVRNGEVWYRVLVGPFDSRSKLAKARASLISNGHQALIMEYKEKHSE
ncbi:SPOR domain-containing protein [Marinagarivorans algicola]|uniref:SPOR domain-containing protein n=1 Tax=Marinagarivorans algicola TaxID=1513270 RepID=UPI0006BA03DE|nr:SPOR domain-containing protein [Marinagarivorans algicola]